MLNLDQYSSLGAVLRDALDRWANETCLIEADRDREKTRLTYSDFKDLALPLARAFEVGDYRNEQQPEQQPGPGKTEPGMTRHQIRKQRQFRLLSQNESLPP